MQSTYTSQHSEASNLAMLEPFQAPLSKLMRSSLEILQCLQRLISPEPSYKPLQTHTLQTLNHVLTGTLKEGEGEALPTPLPLTTLRVAMTAPPATKQCQYHQ